MIGIYISIMALAVGYAINSYSIYKLMRNRMTRYRVQVGKVVMFLEASNMTELIEALRSSGIYQTILIRKAGSREWR